MKLYRKGENMETKKNDKKVNRYRWLVIIMLIIFTTLALKMFELQVIKGDTFSEKANVEFIKQIDMNAPRGEIVDVNGKVLAGSVQSYNLIYVDTKESRNSLYETLDKVIGLFESTEEDIDDTFNLKLDPFRFEFNYENIEYVKRRELRWKKDRGINDYLFTSILKDETGKNKISDLNEQETDRLDELILEFSPEDTYYYLFKHYKMYEMLYGEGDLEPSKEEKKKYRSLEGREVYDMLLESYSEKQLKTYIMIRDSIAIESYQGSKSVIIAQKISEETAFIFLQQLSFLPGIDVETNPIRIYPYKELASHVIGYLNPIPEGSQDRYKEKGYDISSDLIGVSGIESSYEDRLKGNKGGSTVRVDKNGRIQNELFKLETYPGDTIKLTLDSNLQHASDMALEELIKDLSEVNTGHNVGGYFSDSSNATRGAVVVSNVKTGDVLALSSYPKFDPNDFAVPGRLTDEKYEQYFNPDYEKFAEELIKKMNLSKTPEELFRFNDDGTVNDNNDIYPKPFFNYATQGITPSGSTFKLITALAALEENVVTRNSLYRDTGVFTSPNLKGYNVTNDGGGAYGNTNMVKAIKISSNVYFADAAYKLYQKKGLNSIANWAWKLGMGQDPRERSQSTTGIDIAENIYGNVYNHYSKVDLTQKLAMYEIVDFLNKGVARNGYKFRPLDIGKSDIDDEKIALAKEDIKDRIKESYDISLEDADKRKGITTQDLSRDLTAYIQSYIDLLGEEEKKDLENASFYAFQVSELVVYDQISQILSPVNVISSSLGQGDNQNSLIEVNNALATIVNGGTRYKLNLVDSILDANGNTIREIEPTILEEVDIKKENLDIIKDGMREVNKPGGTAASAFSDFPIETGGKTGTITFKEDMEEYGRAAFGGYTAVAPLDDPEIAVSVIVYDATRGYFVAPVALAVFEEYFKDVLKDQYPDYQRQFEYKEPEPTSEFD